MAEGRESPSCRAGEDVNVRPGRSAGRVQEEQHLGADRPEAGG